MPPGSLTPARLGWLPSGCMGANITSDFTLTDMVVQAVLLYWEGVPADMLWQTIIGLQLLAPYGLFSYTSGCDTPASFFSFNSAPSSFDPSTSQVTLNTTAAIEQCGIRGHTRGDCVFVRHSSRTVGAGTARARTGGQQLPEAQWRTAGERTECFSCVVIGARQR